MTSGRGAPGKNGIGGGEADVSTLSSLLLVSPSTPVIAAPTSGKSKSKNLGEQVKALLRATERMAFQAIAKSTPGQVIDLPTPPDHIMFDVKPQAGTQWPKHLNLAPDSNFIHIPIGLTS
jgi:hypothetical protein